MLSQYVLLLFRAIEIPEQSYNDALDLDHNADKGIFPPAFVFSPDDISISAGSNQSVAIYALEVDSIGEHTSIRIKSK